MLTCKIGESIINCIDSPYDRYQLKMWSNKGILKCPVCNRNYEYCHGEVVPPYFRHKDKECSGYYTEPETEEHKKGKTLLYEWLKKQSRIKNLQLEAWLPETKQRPDIYFEQNGKRYVIEYQCTPIASEYIKRRELYKLNNITDIWILGTEKYNIELNYLDKKIVHSERMRTIEKDCMQSGLIYFDSLTEQFLLHSSYFQKKYSLMMPLQKSNDGSYKIFYLNKQNVSCFTYNTCTHFAFYDMDTLRFSTDNEISLTETKYKDLVFMEEQILETYKTYLEKEQEQNRKMEEQVSEEEKHIRNIVEHLNEHFVRLGNEYELTCSKGFHMFYKYKVEFLYDKYFFIKNSKIDYCQSYKYTKRGYNRRGRLQWFPKVGYETIKSTEIDTLADNGKIYNFLFECIEETIRPFEQKKKEFNDRLKEISDIQNLEIKLVDTQYVVPEKIRFKYIKEPHFFDEDYVLNIFTSEVRKLSNKKDIVFLIRGNHQAKWAMELLLDKYKFKNVSLLEGCIKRGN